MTALAPDLQKIHSAGKHLLGLINDVLDLSKIEAGRMDLLLEDFELTNVISEAVGTVRPLAEKRASTLQVLCAADLGTMRYDLTKRQSLSNLLSNACKFTEGGTVTVAAERFVSLGDEWVRMAVADTGVGIPPERVPKLFEPFSQADASTSRLYGVTGLGLALTKRLCRLMGGDITVESSPGQGSRFVFELPATPAENETPIGRTLSVQEGGGAEPVLVVDDDPAARELIQRTLEREGYATAAASSGAEALRIAREIRPSAITLDVMMPGRWMGRARAVEGGPGPLLDSGHHHHDR